MYDANFILNVINAGALIVPFKAYSDWTNGNISEDKFIGIKYVCIEFDGTAILNDEDSFYMDLETSITDHLKNLIADTPYEAFDLFLNDREQKHGTPSAS